MTEAPPQTLAMPDELHAEARDLIRNLAESAGDSEAAYQRLQDYFAGRSKEAAMAGVAAALIVIFGECITMPTGPGEYAEVSLPND